MHVSEAKWTQMQVLSFLLTQKVTQNVPSFVGFSAACMTHSGTMSNSASLHSIVHPEHKVLDVI